ncbi:T9SS type B sorting domain-containing protein [Subsaxibacter sp. CAU 1640]|uniref:T9SS type B sorting domain-containing protein n=1 Tax=Subsaxibacter sp. CAU 1640 TaxID=2933271 RepID=UPI002006D811|nr:choice-of-anchor L domain-containing protein [Subsaxibacter sp. CAU 1640]MCK7591572.1 T9SS type B sorting domain-containing protein [Subsaxibacter sp. CAU 1640]
MNFFRSSLYLLMYLSSGLMLSQQVTINDTFSPQQLIENNLIQGCVETSNITSQINGSINGFSSFGYFEKASSNFPFENGIVLSTGRAISGGNSLNTAVLNEGQSDWLTDPDLEAALGISNTLNATSIEFDFVSISNQIQFNYILASEEYFHNFPCEYSDGFAFLIKEAGTSNPYTNIAVIPGSSTPVNTNTIHAAIAGYCPASNPQYFAGYNLADTNFNGRTKVMSATANITPNVTYHIKLVIADQTDKNYDSAVFIEGNSFNASVDLGDDITTCADSLLLDANIGNPAAIYSWYLNSNLIPGETQSTMVVSQSGSYSVIVEIPLAGSTCTIEDTVEISLSSTQTATSIDDYELCDDSSMDGIETFDLSTRNNEVLASVPASNYNISYHYSASEAQNNNNPINSPIQNSVNNQLIHIRIEDTVNGCLAFSSFHLVVNPLPSITSPSTLIVCDDATNDGITQINFTDSNEQITNGQTALVVTYHLTANAANIGSNAIAMPFVNTSPTGHVYVRVVNSTTGCYTTTTLDYEVIGSPTINYDDIYLDACDQDHDGLATFDLDSIVNDVLAGLTGVSVTFHESFNDAQNGSNPIANPGNFNNTVAEEQIVYIRVEDDTTGCASVRSFEIHSNLLLTGTNIKDFSACDEENDNIELFNLADMATDIINGLEDVSVSFFTSESDRDNQINELDQGVSFQPTEYPTMLYLTITSPTCSETAEIELILNPIVEFPSVGPVDYCDYDLDGFASIDLHSFDSLVTGGQSGFVVTYYASEEDADANSNPLPDFYTNTVNPVTVYPKVSVAGSDCGDVNPFTINVLPAPETFQPDDIFICDDDQDGFVFVNLTQTYSQLVTDMSNRSVSFFLTNEDLINNTNALTNVTNYYTDTSGIYAKVTNTTTGCWSRELFGVYVSTLPDFPQISTYKFCENASDGVGDFFFSSKDSEILNGQIGKQALYYFNQNDADNRQNEIDKNSAYQNSSNPQTIFVRVESIDNQDCYGTSSFQIEVGTNPLFNQPSDWFKCDDISNDAMETFDLSSKISEITQGINENSDVTFYTTQENAEEGVNAIPLEFTNTFNPQQIYVRIDNGNICPSITSFTLNVVQVAQANPATPLEMCDTNYDGIVTFDLTLSEIEILDVRQDNLEIAYFRNIDNLENNTNRINNPSSFTNQSNPQTVYVRITNTLSDCYLAIPLELNVNLPPAINDFGSINVCDNENSYFDLLEVNNLIVNDQSNTAITYHTSNADALANTGTLDTNFTYSAPNTTLFARVENATTGCFITYEFNVRIRPLPVANTPNNLEDCDDDFDGILAFNLTAQNSAILGGQNPNNFTVSYYNSIADAESGSNTLPNTYVAFNGEIIYARVENNTTGCYSTTQFEIVIHPRPVVEIPDQVICLENFPLLVSANTNNPTDTYLWSTNQTTPEIEITTIGTYHVTVTTEFGCQTTQVFNVTESQQAIIEIVETVDFSDPNNITITISGIGNYLYQLDDNDPQESNVFQNVGIGYHTVTVIDLNGCSEISKEVLVLDFPKFMTPNADGYFDTWHIIGVETLPGTTIYIYDRYGKQVSYLTSSSSGWDGNYNGQKMPATDYWFVADVRGGQKEFQAKGHFALRR